MHHSTFNSWRGRASVLAATFAALMLVALGLSGLMAQASAAPVSVTFNSGQLSVGPVILQRQILPATSQFPSDQLPTPQRTDIQLNGTQTGNDISFPASSNPGTQFPYMNFTNPIDPAQKIPFTIRLKGDGLNGTFDAATGEGHLAGNIDIVVVLGLGASPLDSPGDLGVPPLGIFGRCRIADVPVDLSTETKSPFTASRYEGGLTGTGSMTTAWQNLPAAAIENGTAEEAANCGTLNSIIHSPGGLWLANGIDTPPAQPDPPAPTCETDQSLCPPPLFSEITDLTLTPKKKKVKAGKKVKFTAHVTNSGTKAAKGVVVKFKSSNRKVKVVKSKTVTIPPNTTSRVTVKVTVKGKARGSANIHSATSGWTADSTVKIKAKKKAKHKKHH